MTRKFGLSPGRAIALVLALSLMTASQASAAPLKITGVVGKMKRDLGGAIEQVAVLRSEIEGGARSSGSTDVAGISDGGYSVTLASLKRASVGLTDAVNQLRARMGSSQDLRRTEALLRMKVEVTSLTWLLEELGRDDPMADRPGALLRAEETLAEIEKALTGASSWN